MGLCDASPILPFHRPGLNPGAVVLPLRIPAIHPRPQNLPDPSRTCQTRNSTARAVESDSRKGGVKRTGASAGLARAEGSEAAAFALARLETPPRQRWSPSPGYARACARIRGRDASHRGRVSRKGGVKRTGASAGLARAEAPVLFTPESGRRDSNPRHTAWEAATRPCKCLVRNNLRSSIAPTPAILSAAPPQPVRSERYPIIRSSSFASPGPHSRQADDRLSYPW